MVRPQNIGSVTEDGEIFLEKSISGFEVSEDGETFVPADAWLLPDGIRVSALEITEPKQVRYLWTNYAEVHIYGRNGLPLAPFGV